MAIIMGELFDFYIDVTLFRNGNFENERMGALEVTDLSKVPDDVLIRLYQQSRATADGASIVVPAQAAAEGWQARRDEIVAAVEAWEAKRSRAFMDSGTLAVEDALEAALAERGEIEEAIISHPARTLAGLLVKARAAMNSAISRNPGDGASTDLALAWSVARDLSNLESVG